MCDPMSAVLGATAVLGLGMSAKQGHDQRKAIRKQEEAQRQAIAEQEEALKQKGPEQTLIKDDEKKKRRLDSVRAGMMSTIKTSSKGLLNPAPTASGITPSGGSKKKLGE